jgi:FMN phosphatase YigB (HAD superfamily)
MRKKAIIDIDNTLWHFCDELYKQLREINSDMPSPDNWNDWNLWQNHCSEEEFTGAIHSIHLNQDHGRYLPYPEAKDFLSTLKEHNLYIIIASHRTQESLEQTHRWLIKHDLMFDELHISSDKTVLFDETCHIVVDDSPYTLEIAAKQGITALGLIFPWNRAYKNNGFKLFNNLNEILQYILKNSPTLFE